MTLPPMARLDGWEFLLERRAERIAEQFGLSESDIVIMVLGVVTAVVGIIVFVMIASSAFAEGKTDFVATVQAFAIVGSGTFASLLTHTSGADAVLDPANAKELEAKLGL